MRMKHRAADDVQFRPSLEFFEFIGKFKYPPRDSFNGAEDWICPWGEGKESGVEADAANGVLVLTKFYRQLRILFHMFPIRSSRVVAFRKRAPLLLPTNVFPLPVEKKKNSGSLSFFCSCSFPSAWTDHRIDLKSLSNSISIGLVRRNFSEHR